MRSIWCLLLCLGVSVMYAGQGAAENDPGLYFNLTIAPGAVTLLPTKQCDSTTLVWQGSTYALRFSDRGCACVAWDFQMPPSIDEGRAVGLRLDILFGFDQALSPHMETVFQRQAVPARLGPHDTHEVSWDTEGLPRTCTRIHGSQTLQYVGQLTCPLETDDAWPVLHPEEIVLSHVQLCRVPSNAGDIAGGDLAVLGVTLRR
jgi:hypothetical protein